MKIIKVLFILSLAIFPFGELLRLDIGNNIAVKLLDIIVFFTIFSWAIFNRHKLTQIIKLKYLLFPLVGFFALLINLYWLQQNEAITAFFYLVRWIMYAGLFVVVSEFSESFKKKIIVFLFFDGLAIVLFGFLQYFSHNSLYSFYHLGWDAHMYRIFSTFLDPNFTGGFFALYFLFTGGIFFELISKNKSILTNTYFKRRHIYICVIVLLLTLIALLMTFSRSTILMLIVSLIVFLVLIGKKRIIFGVFLAVALFYVFTAHIMNEEHTNLFRTTSTNARLSNYSTALKIIAGRPLLGVGFNSYRYTKRLYGLDHEWIKAPSHADAGVDNSFLFVIATTGIVGFTAYMSIWYMIFKKAYLLYVKNKNTMAIIILSSSAGLFVHALFINSLFFVPIMLWMWVLVGLMKKAS